MVVKDDYIRELGLDPADGAWEGVAHDAVRAANAGWSAIILRRVKSIENRLR